MKVLTSYLREGSKRDDAPDIRANRHSRTNPLKYFHANFKVWYLGVQLSDI